MSRGAYDWEKEAQEDPTVFGYNEAPLLENATVARANVRNALERIQGDCDQIAAYVVAEDNDMALYRCRGELQRTLRGLEKALVTLERMKNENQ